MFPVGVLAAFPVVADSARLGNAGPHLLSFDGERRKQASYIARPIEIMAAQKTAREPFAIDDIDAQRRRLRYRAWHRGTKEMDLLLGPYADAHTPGMATIDLDRLEALMEEADTDLLKWAMGQETPPPSADKELLQQIVTFRENSAAVK